jgi:hypothetical protein
LFFFTEIPLFAQEFPPPAEQAPPEPDKAESPLEKAVQDGEKGASPVYVIRDIVFNSAGRTQPFALMYHGEFRIGERISGAENLEKYIQKKTQLLLNQRVLSTVSVDYAAGDAGEDGLIPVDLFITTTDTWNIIALPYAKFDDNTGFELTLKARDYNFLGAMSPLRIDLGYTLDEDYLWDFSKGSFNFMIDSNTPFKALGYNWNFNFDHYFSFIHNEPLYYKNVTGLSMELPYERTTFTFGFDENIIFNEENEDKYEADYGKRFEGGYMSSELYASWKIPLGFTIGHFGELNYIPKIAGKINYRPGGDVDVPRKGPTGTFSHTIGFGQIDWKGNYRDGLEIEVKNSNEYNFFKEKWEKEISFSGTGHFFLARIFGVSSRLQYRHWFDEPYDNGGDALRGIRNNDVYADYMLSLNMDFPFRLLRLYPSELFNNNNLRLFDFELHTSPFIDLALVRDPIYDISLSPEELLYSGGIEFIIFPAFMRSIYLRISVGFNLRKFMETKTIPAGNDRELFIGLEHHY